MNKKAIYDDIFSLYEIQNIDEVQKRYVRKLIRRELSKLYPQKDWEDLTDMEKLQFSHIQIKEKIINRFCELPEPEEKILRKKIDYAVSSSLLSVRREAENIIELRDVLKKEHYINGDSEENHRMQYEHFKRDIKKYLSNIPNPLPIPSYEKWLEDNEEYPRKIGDYYRDYSNNYVEEGKTVYERIVPQSEIDHYILRAVIKVLEEIGYRIDTETIKNKLAIVFDYQIKQLGDIPMFERDDIPTLSYLKAQRILDEGDSYERIDKKSPNC